MTPERGEILAEDVLGAIKRTYTTALDIIQSHPHAWATHPCPTCRAVSTLVQEPFGCVKYVKGLAKANIPEKLEG